MEQRAHQQTRDGEGGFSLLELMVGLFVLGVMALTVLPNIASITSRSRVIDSARQLETAFQLARMKAINERSDYVVRFTNRGWNIFNDADGNGTRDTGETWVYGGDTTMTGKARYEFPVNGAQTGSGAPEQILSTACRCTRFTTSGTMKTSSNTTTSQVLSIGDGKDYRQITISVAGAIKVRKWSQTRTAWE